MTSLARRPSPTQMVPYMSIVPDNSTETWEYDILTKLIVVGDSGVGKSSLLLRFADDIFYESFLTTIGVDFKIRTMKYKDKVVKCQIWDTAGQERFRSITATYYNGAHGVMVVYDVTDESSFQRIPQWLNELRLYIKENTVLILVGNKCDMEHRRLVTTEQGQALAKEFKFDAFMETSAKENDRVNLCFSTLVQKVVDNGSFLQNNMNTNNDVKPIVLPRPNNVPSGIKKTTCC